MRDYFCEFADGAMVPVALMTTADIMDHLQSGITTDDGVSEQCIRDRLLLEIQIREMGLRNE